MPFNPMLLVFGLIFFWAGVFLLRKQIISKKKNTASVMAELSSYYSEVKHDSHGRSTVYYPIFRYYANGQWYEQKSDTGRGTRKYALGERVEVMYDPEHPENFIIAGDVSSYVFGAVFMLIGLGVCVLSYLDHNGML